MKTYKSQGGHRLGIRLKRAVAAFASLTLSTTTMVVGAIAPAPAVAAPGDGVCYLIADSGGANGGNDLLTIVDRGDFDPATNETNIGTGTGTFNIEAMDMNPATLELYAANANRLGLIDKLTGIFTPLPNTFGTADGALGPISITDVDGLAFDYLTGELWGAERQSTNDLLVKIDITTGLIIQNAFGPGVDYLETDISLLGHDDLDDIAFHPQTGVLYGSITGGGGPGRLVILDTATGSATDVGPFGAGDIEGMRFDAEGFLWGTSGTTPGELFEINITTGAATNPRTVDNGGDYESTVCYVPGSDLWLDKTVSESVPFEGGTTTYTIEVFNAGPANATGVVVEDVLPAGVTFVAASGPGTYDETTGIWNAGAILRNESAFLSITVSIDAGTAGTTITNTATRIAVDQGDAVPNNDTDSVDINPVVGITGLGLDKSSDAGGLVEPGQTITYTLDITNSGTTLLQGISVTDAVPAGTTYVPGSTTVTGFLGADYRDEFNSQSYGNNDGSASFSTNWTEFGEGTNPTGGDIRIITDTGTSPDQDPYQLRLKDDDRGVRRSADLSSAGGATVSLDFRRQSLDSSSDYVVLEVAPSPGGTYRELARFAGPGTDSVYANTGPLALNVGELTGTTTFRLSTSGSLGNGDIVWVDNFVVQAAEPVTDAAGNAPDGLVASGDGYVLPPGETMQVEFDVIADTILSQPSIDNTATVAASGALPASDSVSDPVATADVAIDKTVDNAAPNPSETINYTITVTNNGPSDAGLIEVTDLLPVGVTYVSDDSSGDYDDTTGVWSVGSLASGASTAIVITASVDSGTAGTTITNTATITQTDRPDPDPSNDSDDSDIDVPVVDLEVNKTVDDSTPVVGDTVTFTITITNNGPDAATEVSLDDVLPIGITYVSDTTSTGSYVGGVWTIGTMAAGATETLTLAGTVDPGTFGTTITNTASVASVNETDSDPSNDSDDADIDVQHDPAIQVIKDGPATANIGDTVTYTFTISHTASSDGSPVTIGSVVDDVAGVAAFVSGDTNGNSRLDGGESWIYSATHVVTASDPDPILNTVTVTANDEDGDDLPDATDDHSTDIDHLPVIFVAKTGPAVAVAGDTVTYTFTVSHGATSDGTPVSNLTVSDDVAGAAAYVSGDDGDGLLEAGETWTFSATYTIEATDPDPLVNTGTATGDDEDGDPVIDDDTHTTDVIDPAIQIEKTPDSQTILTGTAATFTITVANTGDADLTDVEVTDALAPACDNLIGDLAAGTSTSYSCSLSNVTSDFTNVALVVGSHAAGGTVTDSDDADVTVIDPAIQIEKTPDTQTILTGSAATFTITVTNTGDADLTDVEVTDVLAPACDNLIGDLAAGTSTSYSCSLSNVTSGFTNSASVVGTHAAGGTVTDSDDADVVVIDPAISISKSPDTQTILTGSTANFTITVVNTGDSMLTNVSVTDAPAPACGGPIVDLAPGDSVSYVCSLANVTSDFTNIASVVGTHAAGGTVTDSDDADVVVIDPAISISKSPDNQQVLPGGTATFTITVTNTGDADLTDVEVTDPLAPACDNVVGDLAAGAFTTYSCSLANVTADFTNTASVVGTHGAGGTVTDSDTANVDVIGPAIDIEKTPDTQQARPGDTVTFDIRVENTGDVTLTDVTVSDAVAPSCDATFASMAPGAVQTYSCTMVALADDYTNTASVTGDDPLSNPVTDSDDAVVDVINPDIDIQKTPDTQQARPGDTVTFDIRVENTGDVTLTDVTVSDAVAPNCDATFASMAPGAVQTYSCSMIAGADDFTNIASVTGDDPNGAPVFDSDTADVDVINPAITIDKTPDSQQARPGDTVTFDIRVENTGDVTLADVTVSDAVAPNCDATFASMAPGAVQTYSCTMVALADDYTNTASVTGDDPNGDAVTDSDDAVVDVINPAITVDKTPDSQQARPGDTVTFTLTVTNTGDVDLANVSVTDAVAPGCDNVVGALAAGASTSYDCTMAALADDFTNTADVTGDDPNGDPVSDSDDADVDVINPAVTIDKTPDTQQARPGDTVTFDIRVENTGDVTLTDVTVSDAVAPNCDATFASMVPGAVETYSCTMAALADDYTNFASVTGDDPNGDAVTDSDDADVDVINPAITIDKTPDSQQARPGDTVTFTISVTNTGDVDLTAVAVSDAVAPACDSVIGSLAAGSSTSYDCTMTALGDDFTNTASVTGDDPNGDPVTDSDTADVDVINPAITIDKTPNTQLARPGDTVVFDIQVENTGDVTLTDVTVTDAVAPNCDATFASLAPGAIESFSCSMTAGADDFTNTADVTADDPNGDAVTDSDDADVDVINPAITIDKTPDTQFALPGSTVTFTITVENTGDVTLTNVTVADAVAPSCDASFASMAPGAIETYDCTMAALGDDFTNTASVTGDDPNGDPVTDSDTADVDVINPAIDIQKTPDFQQVLANGTATFDITVTNTGDVDLTDVTVTDAAAPACENVIGNLAAGDSTTYTCSLTNVTADFTNVASVVATHPAGGSVIDSDTADVDVIGPAVDIEKTPDTQQARAGDTVTFTITVENTGDVALTDVTVSDPVAPSCDATFGSMVPGAVETYTCSMTALADDYTNTANVTADDPLNNPVTDSDDANVDVINPAIDIQKTPDTQQARPGDTVTFTITVENTGDVDLTNVAVTDAVAPACDNVIGALAAGASTSFECTMTALADDFTNTASVTGDDPNGDPVGDSDTADVDVINPAITVDKTPDSQQARSGDTVTFDIRVENTGDVTLTDVVVTDPVAPDCDATYASMAPGAVETYSCTMTALADDFTNTASVTGDDPNGDPVGDSDDADVDVINPAITVAKTPDSQQARPGDTVTFTITVANTGDVDLANVSVTDAVAPSCDATIGALAAGASTTYDCSMTVLADDFTNTASVTGDDPNGDPVSDSDDADVDVINPAITVEKTPDTQSALPGATVTFTITVTNTGDVDLTGVTVTDAVAPSCDSAIGDLAVGESSSYQCTMTAGAVDFTNTADATGNDPSGDPVTDSDTADVDVINPAIDIQKTPDYQQVLANGTATFTITVENTGDVDLTNVTVTDPAASACDNAIGNLAAGASTSYTCSLGNVAADFTNVASVVGTHPAGGTVTDSDTADVDVIGPAIDIEKTPDSQQAREGDTVTFTIRVENTGDVALTDVTVTDAVAPSCDATFASMASGAIETYTCTMTAGDADFTNTAAVTGDDPLSNPVTDTDSADVDVIVPAISITKDPATQQAHDGDTVTFTITVTNTGDVDLSGVTVTDAVAPACDSVIGGLAVGASASYDCSMTAGAVDFTNTASVSGNDPLGGPVTDSDSANVDVINPSILIEKGPDSQQAIAGGSVTFDITVTNNGDVDLSGVTVTDAVAPACDNVIGSLAAGASTTYSCSTTAGASDFTNTASVTGDDPLGTPVNDSDTADVDVVSPAIDIAKNPNSQTLLGGETATFTITVTNLGDVPLTNVVVTDPLAPNCDATFPTLAVGGSETYTCTLANVTGDFTNVAVVAAEHPASPDPITDSDVADVEVIAPEIDIQKTPDTQTIVTGSDVTFTITVENTGDTDLTNVVVTDAQAPACDATFATLLMGEIQSYDCTVTGVTVGFTNTADATADEPSGGSVSDSDTADVTVIDPAIAIDKSPDSQVILPNGDATFAITVTNTGDVELTNVVVSDPQAPNCDATFASLAAGASETYSCTLTGIAAGFTNVATVTAEDPLGNPVGDSDTADVVIEAPAIEITKTADTPTVVSGGDATFTITVTNTGTTPLTGVTVTDPLAPTCDATIGDLAVGASTTYNCTVTGVTADFTNTASVVGTHPLGGTVSDDDSADVDVIAPAVSITKDPATQQVLAGQDATFRITVENTGDVDLSGVTVTDALAPVCDNTIGALAVAEVVSYTCDVTAVSDFTNTAAVSGLDPLGNTVSDSDDAIVDVIAPDIQVEKTPDLQYVVTGDDVTFTITVTNTGDVDLTGVAVTDALAPACDATIGALAAGASTNYDCTVTGVTADFTNNAAVSGLDPLGNTVSDDDDADVDVIDPSISLTKDPATQQILSGQDANFTITVTNTGDSPLTNVIITDAQAPACDAVIPALGAGASTTVTCVASAVTGSFTNTASVVATHAAGGTVSDSDTADVEVLVPEVDIQKTPDLQVAGIGDTVTFDITVTNAGVVPLSNVAVTDALAPNCDATIGDLAVGASTTYSCTLTVTADLTNTAVVDATDAAGNPASDSDTADVDVVAPAISIEKTPDNQSVVLNGTPTFTITVTNTGDVDLSNVVVTDALAPACDATFAGLPVGANDTYTCDGTPTAADFTNTAGVSADSVIGPVSDSDTADVTVLVPAIDIQKTPDNQLVGPAGTATFTITVTNAGATPLTNVIVSDPLAPNCDATFASLPVGGVETYTCDVSGVSGDFTNTASVTGDDPLGNPVTDSDTADVDFVDPAISIEKTPDLQTLLAGEDALFTITVTNTGDTDLTNVVITDPLALGCEANFASLLIGASETVTCDVTAVTADFTNVASVTADTPLGTQVSDSDDALVDVVAPGVQIEKTPDSQQIHSGDDVTFTITVTNNGDQDLVDLTVTDALTPACNTTIAALAVGESTSYDCTATGVTDDFTNIAAVDGTDALGNPVSDSDDAAVDVINPAIDIQKTPDNQAVVINGTANFDITVTNTGDVDLTGVTVSDPAAPACDTVIGDLAVGESVTYSCSLSGVAGDFTNTASVTGTDPLDAPVTDSDTADVTVLVPAIDIQKTPDLQQARAGDTVDFTITVTNAGATPLTNVTVTDAMAPACDTVIGDLAVGESASFTCSMTAGAADFTNTADVAGDDPIGNPVTDSDTADVDIIGPSISIEKSPDGQTVVTGGTATFTIEVTNTGDVDLTGVTVTDAAVPACDATIGDLAVGESTSYTCSVSDVTADFTNIADVVGTDPIGEAVSDSDTADVTVLVPGIDIQKTPDTQTVVEGDDATFTIIVTNTGQTDLFNVTVSDPLAPACDNVIGDLPVGSAPVTYTCTAAAASSFTNTAMVDAVDPLDNPVSDSDTADVVALVRSNINGTIAHDIAGDGVIDGGDLGLGGVDVTATWAGLDGVFGTADDEVFTTTTDGNGDYSFDLVPPGEYQIDVDTSDLPFGVDFQTLDPDAVLDSSTSLTLPEDTTYPDVDFAYTATGSIGDLVWLDLNDDGVQDPGEPGLGGIGVTVTWLGPDGVPGGGDDLVFTTTTAPDGSYLVDGLPAGEFTVVIDGIPAGLSGDLDQTVTLGAAEARDDVDFPLVGTGSIGDQVFEDLDQDDVFDGGEPGVPDVTVNVTWAGPDGVIGTSDDVVFTTVTDSDGQYLVDGLPAGEYFVEIDETTIPADLGTAPPVTVSLPGGGSDLTADFPLVGNRPPVAIDDEDVTDEDTPVVITVLDDDSDPDGHSFAISTTTDPANGSIVVNPDGTITYTPDPGFVGVDTFTYTICELDGVVGGIPATGLCDTATVTVTIVEVNLPPGPEASFQTVVVGDPVSPMPVFDPDGGPVTVTYISGELPPGITMNPDGTFNGVTEEIGTYQVIVEVCDDDDPQICIIHTHTIAVTPVTLPGPGDDPDPDDPPDTLPFTGANFGELLWAALMMLTAGAAMVLYTRRRRYDS